MMNQDIELIKRMISKAEWTIVLEALSRLEERIIELEKFQETMRSSLSKQLANQIITDIKKSDKVCW